MSILELFQGTAAIAVMLVSIYGYWKLRHIKEMVIDMTPPMLNEIKGYLEAWINSEIGQKALFMVGGLIAQGAKGGFGLQKNSGKRGLEGLIIELAGQFIGSKFGLSTGQPAQEQQPQNTNTPKW
jgi:hypothetical protein